MTFQSQGQEANICGQFLERVIQDEFKVRGVYVCEWSDNANNGDLFAKSRLIKNVPYTSVAGNRSRSEFVYVSGFMEVRIECRSQQVPGSVDEKLSALYHNARDAMPEKNVWLVIDGGGARIGWVDWLKKETQKVQHKTIRVLDIYQTRRAIKDLVERGEA